MTKVTIRRTYKDSLFRMIFREKKELLSLYNALNGTAYENEDDMEISTIDDVIYMGYKNDISFLMDDYMNLYEAQSTWNPNLPLRGVFYFSKLYQGHVAKNKLDIYSQTCLKLPTPEYIVFYNGTEEKPERAELRLSDSFSRAGGRMVLECNALVLNINYGHNKELMQKCRKLYEYAYLIAEIRNGLEKGWTLEASLEQAIEKCIREGILADFLRKHRAEVLDVILTQYDADFHIKSEKELSFQNGKIEGREEGQEKKLIGQIVRKLKKAKSPECIADELEEELEVIQRIIAAAEQCAPEYDIDRIYSLISSC